MRTRAALPADARAVAAVNIAAWRTAYRGIMPDAVLDGLAPDDVEAGWLQRIRNAPSTLLVCEVDGRVVGYAASGATRDDDLDPARTAEVYAIYAAPEHWGTGVGRALWEATLVKLRAENFREVGVWALEANARARAFYLRMGLTLDTRATKHFEAAPGVRLEEVRFRLPLGSPAGAPPPARVYTPPAIP